MPNVMPVCTANSHISIISNHIISNQSTITHILTNDLRDFFSKKLCDKIWQIKIYISKLKYNEIQR